MTLRFFPNPRFENELLEDMGDDIIEPTAEAIAETAKMIAPVDTGEYRNSIRVEDGKVIADDDKALIIEYGSIDTPTFAPLRRAAEQVVGTSNVEGRTQ